ncbi:hypothetical protein [Actinospongicola halichondriae]|uniref:hypothetical protein n=1 Tax=Actinospongicola halichondriae TaxID=3236844 RepID=UPI003D3744B0
MTLLDGIGASEVGVIGGVELPSLLAKATALWRVTQYGGSGVISDETGNGYNLTRNGTTTVQSDPARIRLDGGSSTSLTTATAVANITTGPYTIIAVINPLSDQSTYRQIMGTSNAYPNGYGLWRNTTTGALAYRSYSYLGDGTDVGTVFATSQLRAGGSDPIALAGVRYDPTTIRHYRDGVLYNSDTTLTGEVDITDNATMRICYQFHADFYGAAIFTNDALTTTEIDAVVSHLLSES